MLIKNDSPANFADNADLFLILSLRHLQKLREDFNVLKFLKNLFHFHLSIFKSFACGLIIRNRFGNLFIIF